MYKRRISFDETFPKHQNELAAQILHIVCFSKKTVLFHAGENMKAANLLIANVVILAALTLFGCKKESATKTTNETCNVLCSNLAKCDDLHHFYSSENYPQCVAICRNNISAAQHNYPDCSTEINHRFSCLSELTCEAYDRYWNADTSQAVYPCAEESIALSNCEASSVPSDDSDSTVNATDTDSQPPLETACEEYCYRLESCALLNEVTTVADCNRYCMSNDATFAQTVPDCLSFQLAFEKCLVTATCNDLNIFRMETGTYNFTCGDLLKSRDDCMETVNGN